jgi:hypothetical protein
VNRVSNWRLAAGILVLAALGFFAVLFTPIYIHNFQLQNFVDGLTRRVEIRAQPDDALRTMVVAEAHRLDLPVTANDVQVTRGDGMRIAVRYQVEVDLPGYTVNLHFYPGAGSR